MWTRNQFSLVNQLCLRINLIAIQGHFADSILDSNPNSLLPGIPWPGVSNDIVTKHQVAGFPSHTNARHLALTAIVFNNVSFQTITMPGHPHGLVSEHHALLPISTDFVILKQIVRVFVANGNAVTTVVLEQVLLKYAVTHTPA